MATFTVVNLDNSGAGSLRNAIFQANSKGSTDIIDFDTSLSGGTINLIRKELRIRDDLTINGLGAKELSVDAGGNSRVFNVDGDADTLIDVGISGLTITGGKAPDGSFGQAGDGGGILNQENLTVSNSTLSDNLAGTGSGISNGNGDLTITNSTISDNTAELGGGIDNSGNATVSNSTISGNSAFSGGGISNSGDLTISNSTISGNSTFGDGGGIVNGGNLTVSNSTISGNSAEFEGSNEYNGAGGGGISNSGYYSNAIVSNSTISGNSAGGDGGGIWNISNHSNLTVSNSTISDNLAKEFGGGISNLNFELNADLNADLTVTNSTISGNTAELAGGGIVNTYYYYEAGIATVTSSIIAANSNEDVLGTLFTSGGNNLIGNGDGAEGFTSGVEGDLVGTSSNPIDPRLGLLQNNGGPTETQALLPGSLAINAGSNPLNLEFDQRGPGFDRLVGTQADIGAVAVPEPDSTLGLLGVAILGIVFLRKRNQKSKVMM